MIISSPHVRGHTYFYLLLVGLGTLLRNSLALVRNVENAQVQLRLVMDVPTESSLPVSIYTFRHNYVSNLQSRERYTTPA